MAQDNDMLLEQVEALRKHAAELEAQVRQRTFELQVLYDLSHQIGYTLNYDELFRLMLQHLHRVVPYAVSGSFLMVQEPYDLFIQYTRPLSPSLLDEIRQRIITTLTHMRGATIPPGKVRLRTYEVLGTGANRLPLGSLGSVFQVPLIVGPQREAVGLLFIGAEQQDAFREEQVRILYTVSNQASVGIQQLRALLASEEQRLENLVASLPDGVVLIDEHRHIVLVNRVGREYLSMLGVQARVGDVLTHLAQQSLEPLLQPYPVGGHEVEVLHQHATRWTFEVVTEPMTAGPQTGGWTLVIRNITGRKGAEEEIRSLNVQLEQRVQERTAQLEQANQDLQQERDLLQRIMETSPVGIVLADQSGQFIFANSRAEQVLGVPKETILERSYNSPEWGFTHYEGQPLSDDEMAFQRVLTSGRTVFNVRQAITYPDGGRGLLSINAAPLSVESGLVQRVVFTVRDVTRRVQAEESLRLSEAKLRLITTQMPSILWTTDTDLRITDFLGAGLTGLDYDLNAFVGQPIHEAFGIASLSHPITAHRRALRGLSAGYEIRLRDREFEVRVDSLRNKEGQIIGCIGLALDITERKQAEEQIRKLNAELEQRVVLRTAQLEAANRVLEDEVFERKRAEDEIRRMQLFQTTILENIPDGIFVKDAETFQFILFNKAAEEALGMDRQAMIGKTVYDFLPTEIADSYMARDWAVIHNSTVIEVLEENVLTCNKGLRTFHTQLIPIVDDMGLPLYILGISADITESRQAQAELRQAWKAAEAATQAKSEFLANMSHEIRTPLNAIIGMTSLILDTTLSLDQHDFVETIRMSSNALLAIINDVLDFSKIEAGKMEINLYPFNLYDCVEESLELVAARAAEKRLELSSTIVEHTPIRLVGDMGRLRQILVNLLSNAIKFTEQGEVAVVVSGHPEPPDAQDGETTGEFPSPPPDASATNRYCIHITVQDTGIGIPSDRLERLFKSFSQVDTSTTRKYGGTGLGLAISKNLAELMGGDMWVESEVGKGSTFHFTFLAHEANLSAPLCTEAPLLSDDVIEPPILNAEFPISDLMGRRVLIVNDSETHRHILTRQVVSWGLLPCVTGSAAEALDRLSHACLFDLVIIDTYLPENDGLSLVENIASLRGSHTMPILLYVSHTSHYSTGRVYEFGESSILLIRPVKSSQLYEALVQILNKRGEGADLHSESRTMLALPPPAGETERMAERHPLRILLVEDNAFNRKVALRFLQKIGYQADIATTGLEALQVLKERHYDAILMDVQMPDMDGMETTRHIREQWPPHQQPRIIAMTAHALRGDRERCLRVGMDDYISKPVQLDDLIAALERVLPRVHQVGDDG